MKIKIIPVFLPENQCPFTCKFCNVKVANGEVSISSKGDIEKLIENSLKTIEKKYPDAFKEVAFFGGTFTYGSFEEIEDYLKIVQPYIEKGRVDGIRVSTRPDFFDEKIAEVFKKHAVSTVEFGVQSFNSDVLKEARRGHNGEKAKEAVKLSLKHGFKTSVHLMIGLPRQSEKVFLNDIKQTIDLGVDYVRIHPFVVLKDTEFAKEGVKAPDCGDIVEILAKGVYLLKKSGVEVIKLGLQPTDSLNSSGSVLSGCYHQSLKHLVFSVIYRRFLEKLIKNEIKEIAVSPSDLSYFKGYKGMNADLIEKIVVKTDNKIERENVLIGETEVSVFKESLYD